MRYFLLVFVMFALMPVQALEPVSEIRLDSFHSHGIGQHTLDHKTRVTGWRIAEHWYFGRQRGADSGITLVRQNNKNQLSFSKDGIRVTRRF